MMVLFSRDKNQNINRSTSFRNDVNTFFTLFEMANWWTLDSGNSKPFSIKVINRSVDCQTITILIDSKTKMLSMI